MGLRLAAVIRVRNEIDIIESLVRHHAVYFDIMLVLDDGSVDGSYELLCALRDEGLPLVLERTVSVGNSQAREVTRLSRLAVGQYAADWVFPIDADEFVEPPAGLSLKDVLADLPAEVLSVGWSGFLWSREQDEKTDISPVLRMTDRFPARQHNPKVIIPAAVVRHDDFEVEIGNHKVRRGGTIQNASLFTGVELCHYPIRSPAQYVGKVVNNYLQHRASPTYIFGLGSQYDEAFPHISTNIESIVSMMEEQSRRYSIESHASVDETTRHAPLRYVGGPLTHHQVAGGDWIKNILAFAQEMALRFAHQTRQEAVVADALAGLTSHLVDASPVDRVVALQERIRSSDIARADLELKLAEVQAEVSGTIAIAERRRTQCEALEEASRRADESLRAAGQEIARVSARNGELQADCASLSEQLSASERGLDRMRAISAQQTDDLSRPLVRFARWLSRSYSRPA